MPFILLICLLLTGCGDPDGILGNPLDRAKYETGSDGLASFEIGPASNWAEPGLYLDYVDSHNIALKSGNGMLVALLLVCPDTGNDVYYDSVTGLFREKQSDLTYTDDGVKWGGADDRASLPRCRIRHLGPAENPDVRLMVDPGKLYRQEEQQWSKSASFHIFITDQPE
ncbi:MAG: hypothetical protein AAF645_09040 [Myxococcota bacterium]